MKKLFPHQKEAIERAQTRPFFALFMRPGTGKTGVALTLLDQHLKNKRFKRFLLIAPGNLLVNWEMALSDFVSAPRRSYIVRRIGTGMSTQEARQQLTLLKAYREKGILLMINYEKVAKLERELKKFKPDMVIMDESHKLKSRTSQVSSSVFRISQQAKSRLLLSGTPIANDYEDIFMQFKIMDPNIFGTRWSDFRDRYVQLGGYMGKQIVGYRNKDELRQIIAENSYRVKLRDCIELPPIEKIYLSCSLSAKARKYYEEIRSNLFTEIWSEQDLNRTSLKRLLKANGIQYFPNESYTELLFLAKPLLETTCEMAVTKLIRLHQICGGFLTLDSGEVVPIDDSKLRLLQEILTPEPTIIFCQYVAEVERVVKALEKKYRVASYRDPRKRDQVYLDFLNGDLDIIVSQINSGSMGLNLQRAHRVIFYSWNYEYSSYDQAIERIERPGQEHAMEVIHLVAEDSIDEDILRILSHKEKRANQLLDGGDRSDHKQSHR